MAVWEAEELLLTTIGWPSGKLLGALLTTIGWPSGGLSGALLTTIGWPDRGQKRPKEAKRCLYTSLYASLYTMVDILLLVPLPTTPPWVHPIHTLVPWLPPVPGSVSREESLGSDLGLIMRLLTVFTLSGRKCDVWYAFSLSRKDVVLVNNVKDWIAQGGPGLKPKVKQA